MLCFRLDVNVVIIVAVLLFVGIYHLATLSAIVVLAVPVNLVRYAIYIINVMTGNISTVQYTIITQLAYAEVRNTAS